MPRWIVVGLVLVLSGCTLQKPERIDVAPPASPTLSEPSSGVEQPVAPATLEPTQGGWAELEPGIEYREIKVDRTNVQIVRIDPALYRVRVAYDAGAPGRISEWAKALKPLVLINGGYFDDQGRATALTIYDGVGAGTSYEGFGGMLAVDTSGVLTLRSLRQQPYDSNEALAQALQSTPMLVLNGEPVPQLNDTSERARRSVVAVDEAGRMLIIACSWPAFTLSELSRWLVEQQLGIVNALNLDGGSSTGLALNTAARTFVIDSLVRVPQVLVVERP